MPLTWLGLFLTWQAYAYVDLAPTLAKIISDSQRIYLVEVTQFDREQHTLSVKPIRALKGRLDDSPIQHDVAVAGGVLVPRTIQQWAEPGARGILFAARATQLMCIGEGWYMVRSSGNGGWKLGADRADLPLAYYGSVSRLADGITRMLAGQDAILTTVEHAVDDAASFDVALNRANLPGLIRVERIRANMSMPAQVMSVSANPAYFVGRGRAGEEDLPKLMTQLKDPDATVRAESADELRDLGHKAGPAVGALTELLSDKTPRVRFAAASALLNLNPDNKNAVAALDRGLKEADSTVRRDAAVAAGKSGPGAAPLIGALASLLKDGSESTRVAALQAIARLGPTAAGAAPAVVPLLDDTNTCIEAADALGRIGPCARPVPKRMTEMLSSGESAIQWAAVRAMAQIGGKEAHPVVEFIVKKMKGAQEIDLYNMMIYLALLGPDAADAIPAARSSGLPHPVLPSATVWAMQADRFPWEAERQNSTGGFGGWGGPGRGGLGFGGFGGGGPGGPGGGGRGPGGPGFGGPGFDLTTTTYEAYIRELGERLQPLALTLGQKILDGAAGDIPVWGYKLLNCAPEQNLSKLSAGLMSSNQVVRERAAVALGYMGTAAFPARDRVAQAMNTAATEQERHLLEWCLREIAS